MKPHKIKMARTRQMFLLTFFEGEGYAEKEVNGFWLIRSISGNTGEPQVAIYTKENFENYKKFNTSMAKEQSAHIRNISNGKA